MPSEYPDDGARVVAVNPANATASPFGWHDTNGAAGAESTLTEGNNVNAYQDQDNDGNPEPGEQPDGGATLDFTGALVPLNLANDPLTYVNAAVTNLFYWNNIIHDVFYQYGFDEASGNFQFNNYGNGGLGNDEVQAQAQDGSGTNNANFLTLADGTPGSRMQMYLFTQTTPRRDGDLENSIILHEYGHGISNRLTGGPANVSCLNNSEQMGEGWSDFFGLVLTAKGSDTANTLRGIGTYVYGQPVTGPGIRPAQYTYDMSVNTYTYANLPGMIVPHGVGFVWATMTWDMYWNLVNDHGFNPDFYGDWTTGGNNLAIQLVMDGMKLQPCSPGFVDGRNAILQADINLTGGANQCAIWEAYARRGLGFSASQGSSSSISDGTPAFDLPPTCSFLGATPASQQICAGTDADFNVTIGLAFTGNVTMSAANNPPPSTSTFVPNRKHDIHRW
jgi:extracellular elastinolytic metalloproteinase